MVFSNSHHFLQAGSSLALPLFVSCSLSLLSVFHVPATAAFILPYFSRTNLFFQLVFNSLYVFKGIIYLVMMTGPNFSHQHPGTCTNILLWLSTDNQRLSLTRFQLKSTSGMHITIPHAYSMIVETQLSASIQLSVPFSLFSNFNRSLFSLRSYSVLPRSLPQYSFP